MDTENEDIITEPIGNDLQHYDNYEPNITEEGISNDVVENIESENTVTYNETYEQDSQESIENERVVENDESAIGNEGSFDNIEPELMENVDFPQHDENNENETNQENVVEQADIVENHEETEVYEQQNDESDLQESGPDPEEILENNAVTDDNVVIGEEVYEETEIVSEVTEQNEKYIENVQEDYVQEESVMGAGEQEILEVEKEAEVEEDSRVEEQDKEQEDDYGGQVDQEEGEDVVDENVAQHDAEEEEEEEDLEENVKLGHASDDDVRGSEDESNVNDEKEEDEEKNETVIAKMFDSDSEDEEEEKEGDLVADIFGKSDDENEEFVGFGGEEEGGSGKRGALISDSDTDEEDEPVQIVQQTSSHNEEYDDRERDEDIDDGGSRMVYDFDLMLQKKKAERKNPRKRDGGTFISDADDIINAMLTKMKEAAEADRAANQNRKPALKKLKMLPTVVRHLRKQDLKEAFVDNGMIAAIADWLSLLPDKSLVHLSIRTELLKILHDLPTVSSETLKASGVGRSVMILFKHPRETRQNRESAGRLINKWSRPLFGLNDNFKSMSRGEREQRDLEQMPQSKRRRLSSGQNIEQKGEEVAPEPGQLRPGDRGFVLRARVPRPSHKDYVIRPKGKVDSQDDEDAPSFRNKRSKPKKDERLEKHLKSFADRRKNQKLQRAVGISIEGSKMPLT